MAQIHSLSSAEIQRRMLNGSPEYYIELFDQSGGHGLPFFQGSYTQRGHGFLADLVTHYALPALKRAAPHILHGVSQVISDVKKGKDLGQSLKRRGKTTLKRAAVSALTGKGNHEDLEQSMKKREILTGRVQKKLTKTTRNKPRTDFPLFD
jgi:hypothetical protein